MESQLPETGYIRLPAILKILPISRSSWWAGVKSGRFPQAIKLGPRITAWHVEDIRALLDNLRKQAEAMQPLPLSLPSAP